MQKRMATLLAAVLMTCASASAASAFSFMYDFDGAGGVAPVLMRNMDINGNSTINNTYAFPSLNFTFQDAGSFSVLGYDDVTGTTRVLPTYSPLTTGVFTATGHGTLGSAISFDTGTLNIYSGVNHVGTFDLVSGNGLVNPDGTPIANGQISINFISSYLAPDYWYDASGNPLTSPADIVLGFATTNAHTTSTVGDIPYPEIHVANGGQFSIAPVPEPGTFALLGLGLAGLGFGAFRRKSSK